MENQPQNEKQENPVSPVPVKGGLRKPKRPGLAALALFAAGLFCAGGLFGGGLIMQNMIKNAHAHNLEDLPLIHLEEPPLPENALSTAEIVAKVAPSVVSIDIYEEKSPEIYGSGSGIILNEEGYIVTNAHVVEEAFALRVILDNGEGYTAALVGKDLVNDLAVLKIEAQGLVPAEFGDSDQVRIGERAIAIGNAAGIFPGSPTQGIISGVNRELPMQLADGKTVRRVLLQTDAAINPGNSGGALVNMYGQVIGVNVAKLYSVEIDNIGFAIPSSVVGDAVKTILEDGTVPVAPVLGVTLVELNETNGASLNLPSQGLYIQNIVEESDLANYKEVSVGDVIVGAAGQKVNTMKELADIISGMKAGDAIELEVYRPKKDDTVTISPKLYEAPPLEK